MAAIEQVLEERRPALMSIPGVVGVAQSKTEDGTDCILVMLEQETETPLPESLDGYPVVREVTGQFHAGPL